MTAQLVRYVIVGVSNTAITLATYALAVRAGVPAVAASAIAFGAGAANGYRLNRAWTFRSARRGAGVGARYAAVLLVGLAVNALGVALAVDVAALPRFAAEIAALAPATVATFGLARTWVFGEGGRPGRGPAVPRPR